jgi:heme A synthase
LERFRKFALFNLAYNVGVILWGAYVRASGSGAGCGSHWPLCNGEVIPRPQKIQTWIELTHRVSSGLCLVFAILLVLWAWRLFPKGAAVRKAAAWVFGFTISEALVGAALVLLAQVDKDQSVGRAISISIHLVNTLFLLAALTLTVRFAYGLPSPQRPWLRSPKRWMSTGLIATLLLGISGALTALGDTLFRSTSLLTGMTEDFSPQSHFLVKLRVLHPILAVATAVLLYLMAEFCIRWTTQDKETSRWGRLLQGLVLLQVAVGAINLFLLAPIPLQMVHLLMADLVWITLIMLGASTLSNPRRT